MKENSGYTERQVRGIDTIVKILLYSFTSMCISIAAVQRKYENVRRQWKVDEDDGGKELLKEMGKKRNTEHVAKGQVHLCPCDYVIDV